MSAESSPKIVIVDDSSVRSAILEEGLREAGHRHVIRIEGTEHLLERIYAIERGVLTERALP